MVEVKCGYKPFRHWVCPLAISAAIRANLFRVDFRDYLTGKLSQVRENWVTYQNELEKKSVYVGSDPVLDNLREQLTAPVWIQHLKTLTGLTELFYDPTKYGEGVSVMIPEDRLGCHLDASMNLQSKLAIERRLTGILYLSECVGGETELWDKDARRIVKKHKPKMWDFFVFENSDIAYHGVSEVVAGTRVALHVHYYSKLRAGTTYRTRSLFVPNRGD